MFINIKKYIFLFFLIFFLSKVEAQPWKFSERLQKIREQADVVIIDEAHHFRNTGTKGTGKTKRSRYWGIYNKDENTESGWWCKSASNKNCRNYYD